MSCPEGGRGTLSGQREEGNLGMQKEPHFLGVKSVYRIVNVRFASQAIHCNTCTNCAQGLGIASVFFEGQLATAVSVAQGRCYPFWVPQPCGPSCGNSAGLVR